MTLSPPLASRKSHSVIILEIVPHQSLLMYKGKLITQIDCAVMGSPHRQAPHMPLFSLLS